LSYNDGKGRTIENLSSVTGIDKTEIKTDIRDYKLFNKAYESYKKEHPNFDKEIIDINIDPFLRLFKAKFSYPVGVKVSPLIFFEIKYDEQHNITNTINNEIFEEIVKIAFEKTIVTGEINTRNVLTDIDNLLPLFDKIRSKNDINHQPSNVISLNRDGGDDHINKQQPENEQQLKGEKQPEEKPSENEQHIENKGQVEEGQYFKNEKGKKSSSETNHDGKAGGPKPGGPVPKSFFETISWRDKLDIKKELHQGLLEAINELFNLSNVLFNRKKAYEVFPIATGMILRTVYEQALRLQLMHVGLWGDYNKTLGKNPFPTLRSIESFINQGDNKTKIFPKKEMIHAFDRIVAAGHREFLNVNIHYPGNIKVTSDTLEGIASGGMFCLIQNIIDGLSP